MHCLLSLERSPCRFERPEAHPWFHQSFDETVILFDQIVEIRALPQCTRSGKVTGCLPFLDGLWVGCVFVDGDDTRSHRMGGSQRFREKAFRSLGVAKGA
jgi:hypothetical protein